MHFLMLKYLGCVFAVLMIALSMSAQKFEPKWVGQVVLLTTEGDTVVIQPEKASPKVKTTQSAGRILAGIGNVRKKVVIRGGKSPIQLDHGKPITFVVKCRDNEIDPSTFIQVVKFEETRKERKTELANENWLGNVSEGNMVIVPFEADTYGKTSYIITMQPIEGEFGVRILNPDDVDERVPILYCFGVHEEKVDVDSAGYYETTQEYYEDNGIKYPVYKSSDGSRYIMKSKNEKVFIPESE